MNFIENTNIKLLSTIRPTEDCIEISNMIMENKFYFSKGLDIIDFTSGVNWEYTHQKNSSSYLLYLQSLSVLSYLIEAFQETNNNGFINKGYKILKSWIKYEKCYKENSMIWYDHTVAIRTQNLLYFYIVAKDRIKLDEEELDALIVEHIKYLYNDKNYFKNNHGIMMDRALILCGKFIDNVSNELWCIKGISRLKETFYNSFTIQGVHLENSVFYHEFVKKLYIDIESFLNIYDLTLGEDIINRFKKIDDYFKYLIKPNGILPQIGDSGKIEFKYLEKYYKPFIDYDAGIGVLQYENEIVDDSTWIAFVCGASTLTHKHYDDLSFSLYSCGEDVFVDSGSFGYGKGKERRYVQSVKAHNTFSVNTQNYKLPNKIDLINKLRITNFMTNDFYQYIKGINYAYEHIKLERTIVLFKEDIIILFDRAISESLNVFTQRFNIAEGMRVKNLSNEGCILFNSNIKVEIKNLLDVHDNIFYDADFTTPRAVISERTGKLTGIRQIEFNKTGSSEDFLSLISINDSNSKIGEVNYKKETNQLFIQINGVKHNIIL